VTLIGRDPVNEMIARQERFNRLLARLRGGAWTAAVDVIETPDAIVLRAELAAFESEDHPARIGDESLTPKGEPRLEEERRQRLYRAVEWADGFKATVEKGVLTLRLSKDSGSQRQAESKSRSSTNRRRAKRRLPGDASKLPVCETPPCCPPSSPSRVVPRQ